MHIAVVVDPNSTMLADRERELDDAVKAVECHVNQIVCPIWGWVPSRVQLYPFESVPEDAFMCMLIDTPDVEGAGGYHEESDIKVFVEPSEGRIVDGDYPLSRTISHEVIETLGDRPATLWAEMNGPKMVAIELCDPVEGDDERFAGVPVSAFVTPDWFDIAKSNGAGPFDSMGKLSAPFTMTEGGYMIVMDRRNGRVGQVFASKQKGRALKYRNRTKRRLTPRPMK